jgi:hypothetical protein
MWVSTPPLMLLVLRKTGYCSNGAGCFCCRLEPREKLSLATKAQRHGGKESILLLSLMICVLVSSWHNFGLVSGLTS